MDDSNKKQFATLFYGLAEEYGGTITKNGVKLKFEALKKHSIESVVRAANWIVTNRAKTYPPIPTVKEFIDAITAVENPQLSVKSKADLQLDIVLEKLKDEGSRGVNDFEDPITSKLMTTRWPYNQWASTVLLKEIIWFKKEFIEVYKSYSENEIVEQAILEAPGQKKMIPASNLKVLIGKQA